MSGKQKPKEGSVPQIVKTSANLVFAISGQTINSFTYDDGVNNIMVGETSDDIEDFYEAYLIRQTDLVEAEWKTVEFSQGPTAAYTKDFNIKVGRDITKAGFWLGTARQTQVLFGSLQARLCNGEIKYKETNVTFRWHDTIDANANPSDPFWLRTIEAGLENLERVAQLEFDVLIKFTEKNDEER